MKFSHFDLGFLHKGQKVEVTLTGNAANVHLMTCDEFNKFKSDSVHRGLGGLTRQSPVYFYVPFNSRWHVTVDFGGYIGKVETKVVTYPVDMPQTT